MSESTSKLQVSKYRIPFIVFLIAIFLPALPALANIQEPKYDQSTPISMWQTYEGGLNLGIHEYVSGTFDYQVTQIKKPSSNFKSGYLFIRDRNLFARNLATNKLYSFKSNGEFKRFRKKISSLGVYKTSIFQFNFDYEANKIYACLISNIQKCNSVDLHPGTFPYMFAEKNNSVITISNWGDALLWKDGNWCRMTMASDLWACENPQPDILRRPREIQFYSSIHYQEKVLVGEWPTGRIYEFDGAILKPSDFSPPFTEEFKSSRLGFEAQSMAVYCGDLFVGYWPKGEVWRWDRLKEKWSLFYRFFSESPNESFVPYANRTPDGLPGSFFGQRITSLIPFGNDLYVATSNLGAWTKDLVGNTVIGRVASKEYGAVYKISRYGCKSTYYNNKLSNYRLFE
jgi:hypothetical protein